MSNSTPFLEMATRIDRAEEGDFGGAIVLRSPDGKTVAHLLSSPETNVVAFWGFVKSVIEDAFNEYQNNNIGSPLGFPRR